MNFIKRKLDKKGFTLVELLIVIAVLGIIAGIGVNSMSGITDTFKNKADVETAKMLARNIEIQIMAGGITKTTHADAAAIAKDADVVTDFGTAKSQTNPDTAFTVSKWDWDTGVITISWAKTGDATGTNIHSETIAKKKVE